jgi:hypothetical protein
VLDGAIDGARISRGCAWLSRSTARLNACIHKLKRAFLSWIGIEDIGRRDIGVEPGVVPIGGPCPEWTPRSPADSPASPTPTESKTPTAAAPSPSPAPIPAGPSPAAAPSEAVPPSVAAPTKIVGNQAGAVEGRCCRRTSNLSPLCAERVPLSVGYSGVIRHGGRPCCHGGSAGPSRSTARTFATYRPGVAGWELMPSGRCVAGAVTFPRPWMSGTCTACGSGTNARPRGRSPTAKAGRTAMIAAAITAAVDAARGGASAVETSTAPGVRASATTTMTTTMLSESGRGKEYESKERGS